MKVLIIEDEAPAFRRLQKLLEEIDESIEIVEVFDGVREAVKWFSHHEPPDLIFMDIQLSDGLSFEIFDQVEITKPVIFTTAFDEYMLKAFKVNSIDYLLKPINKEDLQHSLNKYRQLKSQFADNESPSITDLIKNIRLDDRKFKSRFLVKMGEKMISVDIENITGFMASAGLVYLLTTGGKKYLMDQTLDEIMKELDPEKYYRVNRQFILAYTAIDSVHKFGKSKLLVETTFAHGDQIIVSSEKATAFKQQQSVATRTASARCTHTRLISCRPQTALQPHRGWNQPPASTQPSVSPWAQHRCQHSWRAARVSGLRQQSNQPWRTRLTEQDNRGSRS